MWPATQDGAGRACAPQADQEAGSGSGDGSVGRCNECCSGSVGSAGVTPVSGSGSVAGTMSDGDRAVGGNGAAAEAAARRAARAGQSCVVGGTSYCERAAGTRSERNASRSARMAAALGYRRSGWYASSLLMMAASAGGHDVGQRLAPFVRLDCVLETRGCPSRAARTAGARTPSRRASRRATRSRRAGSRAPTEPLGRGVADRAADVRGDLRASCERLRDAEVEHLSLARPRTSGCARLQVGVHDRDSRAPPRWSENWCALSRNSQIQSACLAATAGAIGPAAMRCAREPPSTYSIAM